MNHHPLNLHQQNIYNHLPCGCMSVDIDGLVINANDTFLVYVGYEREEIINHLKIDDILTSDSLGHVNKHIKPRLNLYGYTDESNLSLITKEGNPIPCSICSILEKDELAKPQYYHYTVVDISDKEAFKKTMLVQMRRAEKAEYKLKKLTSEIQDINLGITHEIYNPLRNILGLITLLKKNHHNSFNINGRQFLDFVGESGEKIRQHLTELLKFSTNGKGILDKEYVDLNIILENVKLNLNDIINKYDVSIQVPKRLPSIFGVSQDLNLLFYNLIKNAIQFKKEASLPQVIIKYEEDNELYHFTIEDNGSGIEKEYHRKIFEEYFHLDPKGDDCAGLGLSESRSIVENHKGTIGVISSPGKGCTIFFSLEK